MLKSDLKNDFMIYNEEFDMYFHFNGSQTINIYEKLYSDELKNTNCITIGTSKDHESIENALKVIDFYINEVKKEIAKIY